MSFASAPRDERRRKLTDLRDLRALAHPLRLALLDHLMSFGEQTAARCAAAVGSTTSNCSYHLRALGRAGLVARAEASDGRQRPVRAGPGGATASGLTYGDEGELAPAAAGIPLVLDELALVRAEELPRRARRLSD